LQHEVGALLQLTGDVDSRCLITMMRLNLSKFMFRILFVFFFRTQNVYNEKPFLTITGNFKIMHLTRGVSWRDL